MLENSGVCLTSFRTWEDDRSDIVGIVLRYCLFTEQIDFERGREGFGMQKRPRGDETRNQRDGRNESRKENSETGEEREVVCMYVCSPRRDQPNKVWPCRGGSNVMRA